MDVEKTEENLKNTELANAVKKQTQVQEKILDQGKDLLDSSIKIQKTSENSTDEIEKIKKDIAEEAIKNSKNQQDIKEKAEKTEKKIKVESDKELQKEKSAEAEKKKIEKRIYVELSEEQKRHNEQVKALNDIVTSNGDAEEAQYKIQEHIATTQKELLKQAKDEKAENSKYYKKSSLFFKEGREEMKAKLKKKATAAGLGILGKGLGAVGMKSMGKYFSRQSEVIKDKLGDENKAQKEGLAKYNNPEHAVEEFNKALNTFSEGIIFNSATEEGKESKLFDGTDEENREKQSMIYSGVDNTKNIEEELEKIAKNSLNEKDDRGNNKEELKENQEKKDDLKDVQNVEEESKMEQLKKLDTLSSNIEAGTAETTKMGKGLKSIKGMMGVGLLPVLAVVATALGAWAIGTAIFKNFIEGPLGAFLDRDREKAEKEMNEGTEAMGGDIDAAAKKFGIDKKELSKKIAGGVKLSKNEREFVKVRNERINREAAMSNAKITPGKTYDAMLKMSKAEFRQALANEAKSDGWFGDDSAATNAEDAIKQYDQQALSAKKRERKSNEGFTPGEVKTKKDPVEDLRSAELKFLQKRKESGKLSSMGEKKLKREERKMKIAEEQLAISKALLKKPAVKTMTHIPSTKEVPITQAS